MSSDIQKAVSVLKKGGNILYPTDTIWGIGCDATNVKAADKIYSIKGRSKKTSFIVLVHEPDMIRKYVESVPGILWDLLDSLDFPTTIIYSNAKNLARNVVAADGTIGIRLVKEGFCHNLVKAFNKPIVSTSANFTGEAAPLVFREIPQNLIDTVDYAVTTGRDNLQKAKPSTIIRLKPNGEFDVIRE
jgi:L-threonylcarbamoyladenylate synthase